MPTRFADGPAAGEHLDLRRCPVYLRIVRDHGGKLDALDQLEDQPQDDETVMVYERVEGSWGEVFVRPGGRFEYAIYEHRPDVDGEQLRETGAWQAWVSKECGMEIDPATGQGVAELEEA